MVNQMIFFVWNLFFVEFSLSLLALHILPTYRGNRAFYCYCFVYYLLEKKTDQNGREYMTSGSQTHCRFSSV